MCIPTFSIQWHITTLCDQRCRFCYLFNSPDAEKEIAGSKKVNINVLKAIADDLVLTCQHLGAIPRTSLTGGDPILSPFFWDLLAYLNKLGVKAHVLGNPFHITTDVAKRLFELGIRKYQMSLDGMKELHDLLRKVGSFNATTRACDILQSNGIDVSIMSTVSPVNAVEMPMLVKHVVDMGARVHAFARYCPNNNDKDSTFPPKDYRKFLAKMWGVYSEYSDSETRFVLKDHLWCLFLMEEGLFNPEDTGGVIVDGCGMGISHLTVLADGTVFACRRFNSPVGRVPEQSLYDIFLGAKMEQFRDVSLLAKCSDCELLCYCRGCRAVAHCVNNDWTSADPQCWK